MLELKIGAEARVVCEENNNEPSAFRQQGSPLEPGEKVLVLLAGFTGLTAFVAGLLLMIRPDGSLLQVAPSALAAMGRNSPFSDFLLPGLALTAIIGGGMVSTAVLLVRRHPFALELAMLSGAALVIFEAVEFAALGFMPLQLFEEVVALFILGTAARRWRDALHPLRHARQ